MVAKKGLVAEASAEWKTALVSAGFRKRSGEIYTRPLITNVFGWLGINKAVHREDGLVAANPVVGVRHQELERAVAELLGERFQEYIPPTVSVSLGYLMPESRHRSWLFGSGQALQETASGMVDAIVGYGVPFMERHTSLEDIVREMISGKGAISEQRAFRLPVAYLMIGSTESARESLAAELGRIGDRQDLAAQRFRRFAAAFEERLAAS